MFTQGKRKPHNIIHETSRQSRFDARYWMLGAGTLGRPRGMVRRGRWEEGSGWGTRVYPWQIHVDIWQNQYNIVKLKNKINLKKKSLQKRKSLCRFYGKSSFKCSFCFPSHFEFFILYRGVNWLYLKRSFNAQSPKSRRQVSAVGQGENLAGRDTNRGQP